MDAGLDPLKDVQAITVKGHDQGVLAVLNGDVDAAAIFQDARNTVVKDYPKVFEDTQVLAFTDKIPNDTISVRSDMNKEWIEKSSRHSLISQLTQKAMRLSKTFTLMKVM